MNTAMIAKKQEEMKTGVMELWSTGVLDVLSGSHYSTTPFPFGLPRSLG